MEKHFKNVLGGSGKACSTIEKTWLSYWTEHNNKADEIGYDEHLNAEEISFEKSKKRTESTLESEENKDLVGLFKQKITRHLTDIESRDDLSASEKSNQIIHMFAVTCAVTATQPLSLIHI